jgi:CRP-like cAMP-binding protein/sugar phosphate isomerase/epimerase
MDYIDHIVGQRPLDKEGILRALEKSLFEKDPYCRETRRGLRDRGLSDAETLALLAHHKSYVKYGYCLSSTNLFHLLDLAEKNREKSPLQGLFDSPFILVKTCWIYEHAPHFLFYNESRSDDLDEVILEFAREYDTLLLKSSVPVDQWERLEAPRRVIGVSFWDRLAIDPVSLLDRVRRENIEGLELSIDFHPFNYKRLLPEELWPEKREEIREACRRSGLKIDIHSPIVGPYAPFPDPRRGKQLFYDPLKCFDLMCETIDLARDIGAGAVVIHLIDTADPDRIAQLVMKAGGSKVRVTIENYCQTSDAQNADALIACADSIIRALPRDVRKENFGITMDVGHLNIEGEDPLIGAEKIGRWCLENGVYMRVHATDNYGRLLFSPPAYSADVHGNVSGRGINNSIIIKLLRTMGLCFDVVAEQIQPLTDQDIAAIHLAQTSTIDGSFESFVSKGREGLSGRGFEALISPEVTQQKAYLFLLGMEGFTALKEYLVYRKIQDQKYLSVDEAKRISQDFMKMPKKFRKDLIEYLDDLLLPVQSERGVLQKGELDLICHNISGALFGTLNNEHLNQIFSQIKIFKKGNVICEQDTYGREMYYIKEGEVDVYINGSLVASLAPGEIFGEISLFYNVKRTATIQASADDTTVGVLTRNGFEAILKNSQPYSHDLIYRLYNILPERLRNLNEKYRSAVSSLHMVAEDGKRGIPRIEELEVKLRPKRVLFPRITQEGTQKVFREMKTFDADELIFAEGDGADGAYLLLEGRVKAVTFSEDYQEIVLGEIAKNEIFGEMALIDDKPRSASIVTMTPCRVAFVDRRSFDKYIETRSDLAFSLMAFICLSLFRRILTLDRGYAEIKKAFGKGG